MRELSGMVTVEIKTASVAELLSSITGANLPIYNVTLIDPLTITGQITRADTERLGILLSKRNEKMYIKKKTGLVWSLQNLLRRPLVIFCVLLLLGLTVYLPTRVLFIRVEGNQTISTNQIIEEAEKAGVCFGASRRQINSERIKNALLLSIPQLQWLGINTYGCVAVISVEERSAVSSNQQSHEISSVVAGCDGIIQSMIVTRGNPLCAVGQAVCKDQVLVSAYTDCGSVLKATRAEAEIIACTYHTITAITPRNTIEKSSLSASMVRCSLRIGKKLIKLYKDSGISGISCDKIYSEYQVKLPGGFLLPIVIIKEQIQERSFDAISAGEQTDYSWMQHQLDCYLLDQLVAGKITTKNDLLKISNDAVVVSGEYICFESIGVSRNEEIDIDGKRS